MQTSSANKKIKRGEKSPRFFVASYVLLLDEFAAADCVGVAVDVISCRRGFVEDNRAVG